MPLKLVTITGADEWTHPDDLRQLSAEFPFVEWAFLLSLKRQGLEPRYPCLSYLQTIGQTPIRKALHLCGSLARNAARNKWWSIETALTLVPHASRIQINLGHQIDNYPEIRENLLPDSHRNVVQIIIQVYAFDIPIVEKTRGFFSINQIHDGATVFLHDASGGRGLTSTFQKPVNANFTGFAGGITPDNVAAKIDEIEALGFSNPYWIDVESGVRTDDRLDLAKVRRVLEIAARRVGK